MFIEWSIYSLPRGRTGRASDRLLQPDVSLYIEFMNRLLLLFLLIRGPLSSTLFPYTTLFRSRSSSAAGSPTRTPTSSATSRRCADSSSRTRTRDRKSTRLNSSHTVISYAVFCLKKKKKGRARIPQARAPRNVHRMEHIQFAARPHRSRFGPTLTAGRVALHRVHEPSAPFVLVDPGPAELYPLSLHDALPISLEFSGWFTHANADIIRDVEAMCGQLIANPYARSEEHTSELQSHSDLVCRLLLEKKKKRPSTHTTSTRASECS